MTDQPAPAPLPQRTPGATFNADARPAISQHPTDRPTAWTDTWTRPAAHTAFGAPREDQQQ